jgi:hypothetical protein
VGYQKNVSFYKNTILHITSGNIIVCSKETNLPHPVVTTTEKPFCVCNLWDGWQNDGFVRDER